MEDLANELLHYACNSKLVKRFLMTSASLVVQVVSAGCTAPFHVKVLCYRFEAKELIVSGIILVCNSIILT